MKRLGHSFLSLGLLKEIRRSGVLVPSAPICSVINSLPNPISIQKARRGSHGSFLIQLFLLLVNFHLLFYHSTWLPWAPTSKRGYAACPDTRGAARVGDHELRWVHEERARPSRARVFRPMAALWSSQLTFLNTREGVLRYPPSCELRPLDWSRSVIAFFPDAYYTPPE